MGKNEVYGKISAALGIVISVIAVISTGMGIWNTTTYGELLSKNLLSQNLYYGSVAQDISMLLISVILFSLSVSFLISKNRRVQIAITGLVWCEFYAFGLYVVQGQYTNIYYLYLIIFGLSIYGMIFGLLSWCGVNDDEVTLPKRTVNWIGGFLIFILVLMIPLWIMRLVPGILAHQASETYGVFVMDLGIVFPAIGIIVVLLFKRKAFGKILAGVALIKICSLCLTWCFAELYGPLIRDLPIVPEMAVTSGFFTVVSGILLIPYFKNLKIKK